MPGSRRTRSTSRATGDEIRGPWFVGDTVITALYQSVSGYAVADGKEKWPVDLPADICA